HHGTGGDLRQALAKRSRIGTPRADRSGVSPRFWPCPFPGRNTRGHGNHPGRRSPHLLPGVVQRQRIYLPFLSDNMTEPILSHSGRRLLNRRDFLASTGSGLGGIALLSLLAEQGVLAANKDPYRPLIRPEAPFAARQPHFPAKAKRVIMIFCSGACSHLDTWDYKPELIKRHGQPMPGAEELITFQGGQGNLTRSPYEFKPRGQSG